MTTLRALAEERFVSLTTFRRSGQGVATPVWLVRGREAERVVLQIRPGLG